MFEENIFSWNIFEYVIALRGKFIFIHEITNIYIDIDIKNITIFQLDINGKKSWWY